MLAERTWVGEAKGRSGSTRVSEEPHSPRHGPTIRRAVGWAGGRDPMFYLFLGRSQFALSSFLRHRGAGRGRGEGGPHHHDPGNQCELLPAATAQMCD